jgi:Putative Se/S carrier protein-like
VFAFESTHLALEAEDALKGEGLSVVPIPTPATLGGLCGLAMRVPPPQADRAREVLVERGVEPREETVIDDF